MQTKVIGSAWSNRPAELAVDPRSLAARIVHRPYDYSGAGKLLGMYRVVAQTAAFSFSGAVRVAGMRWASPDSFFVLLSLRVGISVTIDSTADLDPLLFKIIRQWTVGPTVQADVVPVTGNNGKMQTSMASSFFAGQILPGDGMFIANLSTGALGGDGTADAHAHGMPDMKALSPTYVVGTGFSMSSMYATKFQSSHPYVFSQNEGYTLEWNSASISGIVTIETEWAEVIVF